MTLPAPLSWLLAMARWTLLGLTLSIPLAFAALAVSGHKSYVVMSGSMEPTLAAGDVIVNRPIQADEARVGDVITFRSPDEEIQITHRVAGVRMEGDRVQFETRGDANNAGEEWRIDADGTIGRVTMALPAVGHALGWIKDPARVLYVLVIPAVLLGLLEIRSIWRRPRHEPDAVAPEGEAAG